jgi:cell wall-associated NlpC family hydrolase
MEATVEIPAGPSLTDKIDGTGRLPSMALMVLLLVSVGGCSGIQRLPDDIDRSSSAIWSTSGDRVLAVAERMLGVPYRYGGVTPHGFDCSGLVLYAHNEAGIRVPRTAAGQLNESRPVTNTAMRRGDLLFFRLSGNKVSHVGIYAGGNQFVHAASTGKTVSYASLNHPYWRERLIHIGRLY